MTISKADMVLVDCKLGDSISVNGTLPRLSSLGGTWDRASKDLRSYISGGILYFLLALSLIHVQSLGVCLTVTSFTASSFKVGISPETLRKTNLGTLKNKDQVNLERAMSFTTRFGGHFVQGHVDCTVELLAIEADPPNSILFTFRVPKRTELEWKDTEEALDYLNYIVPKGYVCLDGTSLTVVSVDRTSRTFKVLDISIGIPV